MKRCIMICAMVSTIATQAQADAVFSGRLAVAPCRADGNLIVVDADIRDGEDVECRASGGGAIHLTETTIPAGARFAAWVGGLSVITECGTGDVYVVNATGETNETTGLGRLYGNGLCRLSRVEWGPLEFHNAPSDVPVGSMGPKLQPVSVRSHEQNPHRCHVRSAATFWANESHELELYCSEFSAVDGERRMHSTRRRID